MKVLVTGSLPAKQSSKGLPLFNRFIGASPDLRRGGIATTANERSPGSRYFEQSLWEKNASRAARSRLTERHVAAKSYEVNKNMSESGIILT